MPEEPLDYANVSGHKVNEALEKVTANATGQLKDTAAMAWEAIKKGALPKDILGTQPETIEYIYSQAYNLYNQGKYKEALFIFQMLLVVSPEKPRHGLGAGACLHRMGQYEDAGKIYLIAAPLDPENPLPYFHAADCYIKLNAMPVADFHLKKCLEVCGDKEKFALIRDRAQLMLEGVHAEMIKQGLGSLLEEDKEDEEDEAEDKTKENPAG